MEENKDMDWDAHIEKEAYKAICRIHNLKLAIPGQIKKIKEDPKEKEHNAAISIGVNYFDRGFVCGAMWAAEFMELKAALETDDIDISEYIDKSFKGLFDFNNVKVGDILTNKIMVSNSETGYDYEVIDKKENIIHVKELQHGGVYEITPSSTCLNLRIKK